MVLFPYEKYSDKVDWYGDPYKSFHNLRSKNTVKTKWKYSNESLYKKRFQTETMRIRFCFLIEESLKSSKEVGSELPI